MDNRDAWAETPAMWLEVYRWYDTRLLGPRNLLLERRAHASIQRAYNDHPLPDSVSGRVATAGLPRRCFLDHEMRYSTKGQLEKLLFRIESPSLAVNKSGDTGWSARIIPEVLASPVLGNHLPHTLPEFAALFQLGVDRHAASVDQLSFEGPGTASYSRSCDVELLRPVP